MEPVSPEAAVAQPEPKFPGIVLAAGIIWIVVGGVILLGTVVLAVLGPMLTQNAELAVFLGLFGGAFILVGVQTVRGTAADTLGNGIGSIIFGILIGGLNLTVQGGGSGLGLIVAGILALVGRSEYKAWRESQKAKATGQLGRAATIEKENVVSRRLGDDY